MRRFGFSMRVEPSLETLRASICQFGFDFMTSYRENIVSAGDVTVNVLEMSCHEEERVTVEGVAFPIVNVIGSVDVSVRARKETV